MTTRNAHFYRTPPRCLPTAFAVRGGVWILGLAILGTAVPGRCTEDASAGNPAPAERIRSGPVIRNSVDFRNPRRHYETVRINGAVIHVEKQLLAETPEMAQKAIQRLSTNRAKVLERLPVATRERLAALEWFLLYGSKAEGGGWDTGLEYFQHHAPQHYAHIDPRWGNAITVYSADNYARISDLWALKVVVHELAHAYHLTQWPERQADILQAWEHAVELGLYCGVEGDDGQAVDQAYAVVNQLEYFAELSCMTFAGCQYYPFNRAQLKTYDPAGFAMIVKMWGL